MRHVDVLIIGGGPAGAAAAIRTKQLRPMSSVVLLDKADFPRDKPCGDGLGPHAVAEAVNLGAADLFVGRVPVSNVRLVSPGGAEVVGAPPKPGFVIPRYDFDAGLVSVAQSLGVEVVRERVSSIATQGDVVSVNDRWRAPWLVAADGVSSRTRRLLGGEGGASIPFGPGHVAIAVRGYAPCDHHRFTIAWQRRNWPAYSWEFPIGDGRANIGYGYLLASGPKQRPAREELWEVLAETVSLVPDPSTLRAHHLVATTARADVTVGRVLFCGDAAGMINPLTGEGIYYALASGRLAAAALVSEDPPRAYRRGLAREFGRHFRSTRWAHRAQRLSPRMVDAGVAAAGRNAQTFARLTELAIGNGTLTGR